MGFFKTMQSNKRRNEANAFAKEIKSLDEEQVMKKYLSNSEYAHNEMLLSQIFFDYPNLIKILPLDFQIQRANSNLDKFKYTSNEAKTAIVKKWIEDNKLFMNALAIGFSDEELISYLKIYFDNPLDLAKLYMEDLDKAIRLLSRSGINKTQEALKKASDKFNDAQWEIIIKINPLFIKYANQSIQNKYADDEKYKFYTNSEARSNYVNSEVSKLSNDISLFAVSDEDVQIKFVNTYPYMINYIDVKTITKLLIKDINLLKYVNIPSLKSKTDKGYDFIYDIINSTISKPLNDIVNVFIDKCVFNAKGKLYRFDIESHNISYQYTKKLLGIFQQLNINQVSSLINIDENYALAYIVPIYNYNSSNDLKINMTNNSLRRCLDLFKVYYNNDELYNNYESIIKRIYELYIKRINDYDYQSDYNCIFDLFKVLFNKSIMLNNTPQSINEYLNLMTDIKEGINPNINDALQINKLNSLLTNAYKVNITNNKNIYRINSLEQFDPRLSFIDINLFNDFCSYNFINFSTLLYIVKNNNRELFNTYYEILSSIYGKSKESLFRAIENFTYYKEILSNINNQELSDIETNNLIELLSSFGNKYNLSSKSELSNYGVIVIKSLVRELSGIKDIEVYKNILSNYLFNKGYNDLGNSGWLEVDTIKQLCDMYEISEIENITINNELLFNKDELSLFILIKLLFETNDLEVLLEYVNNLIDNKVGKNSISTSSLFLKLKKYRCELINYQIIKSSDLETLMINNSNDFRKEIINGVNVYTTKRTDFKVLCSNSGDGIHYVCTSIDNVKDNCFAYDKLIKNGSIRFTSYEDKTIIKFNKDRTNDNSCVISYILVVNTLTEEIIQVAKDRGVSVLEIEKNEGEKNVTENPEYNI